jgi:large subunit ribosomal protein L10
LAISREKKQQMVADYAEKMSHSQAMIFTDYRGLTVANMTNLRQQLRDSSGLFQVIKNTLFELALKEAGLPVPVESLDGPVAVGYCLGEVPPIAKVLVDFADETKILQIKGAILGTSFLDESGVKDLANLPPREILLAQLLGAVQGPMSSLVSTINAPLRELVQVLQARAEQGQEAAA